MSYKEAYNQWEYDPSKDKRESINSQAEHKQLTDKIAELEYIVNQFRDWVGNEDTGCPRQKHATFPCKKFVKWQKSDKEDGSQFDCLECHNDLGCWVEYYQWEYQQKKASE